MINRGSQVLPFIFVLLAILFVFPFIVQSLATETVQPPWSKIKALAIARGVVQDSGCVLYVAHSIINDIEVSYFLVYCATDESIAIFRKDGKQFWGVGMCPLPGGVGAGYLGIDVLTQYTTELTGEKASALAYEIFRELVSWKII